MLVMSSLFAMSLVLIGVENPERFPPECYFEQSPEQLSIGVGSMVETQRQCPFHRLFMLGHEESGRSQNRISLPLAFAVGPRKCLGEHFARYEMKMVLAILPHRYNFQSAPNCGTELELGKFGLFITAFPKNGINLIIRRK